MILSSCSGDLSKYYFSAFMFNVCIRLGVKSICQENTKEI